MLYEMCALEVPFKPPPKGTNVQLQQAILKGKYTDIPSGYSKELQYLIECMLTLRPEERPNIDDILNFKPVKDVLQEILNTPEYKNYYDEFNAQQMEKKV